MNEYFKKYLILAGVTILVCAGLKYLLPLVIPFIFSFFLARILRPWVEFFKWRCKISKAVSSPILVVLVVSAILVVTGYVVTAFFAQLTELIKRLPEYESILWNNVTDLCSRFDSMMRIQDGNSLNFLRQGVQKLEESISGSTISFVTKNAISVVSGLATFGVAVFISIIASLILLMDKEGYGRTYRRSIAYQQMVPVFRRLQKTGFAYLRSQMIIIFLVSVVGIIGLYLIRCPYAILWGICIAIFDAFPIVGSGSILIPWAIIKMAGGNFYHATVLLTVYFVCLLLREALEPKLFGQGIGIKSLYVLISVYAGIQFFGLSGLILGPVAMVTVKAIWETKICT